MLFHIACDDLIGHRIGATLGTQKARFWCGVGVVGCLSVLAAEPVQVSEQRVVRTEDSVQVFARLSLRLSQPVEEALLKGVPLFFVWQADVVRDGRCVFSALAMNDVVVNRGGTSGMVELRVEVGGRFVSNQRADGLIIASPTGSTAYSLSAGGPMLHPSIPGWVLVPIAPHTLSNRPIVLSDATEVAVEVVSGRDVSANFDMQSLASLQHGDRILVRRSEHCVRFLHPVGWNYFATLRKKLRWNEGGS